MNPDRWQRICTIFEVAIKLPAGEVESFLRLECGADNDLYDQLQGMIRDQTATGVLDRSLYRTASATGTAQTLPVIGYDQKLIGTRLKDRYQLRRELGHGGFGVVYLATDEQLAAKRVVVKIMRSSEPDPWRLRKFRTEIEALARLNHPGIVTVSDSGETDDGRLFLVMEYVEGTPLRSLIKPNGSMEFEKVADIVRQIGRALDSAHLNGIWHRDLKPENIMIQTLADGEQVVKLIDFGIATVTDSQDAADTGMRIAGTIRYMAPEQLTGRPSAASDIYALGVIACEMVTGKMPFPAENAVALYAMQKAGLQPGPRASRPDLPLDAERSILKALEFDAVDRHPAVLNFTQEFAQALRTTKTLEPVDVNRSAKPPRRSFRRLGAKLAVVFAAVLLLSAGALAIRTPHFQTSMVVFQIDDLSNDPAWRPLSAGLTGELVSRLIRVEGLSVKQYYGTRGKANTGAIKDRFYLDGDLQKYQNQVRLTMRMTDTEKGDTVVWSDSFDHNLDNPLQLESDVSQRVVDGLENRVFSEAPQPVRVQFKGAKIAHSLISFLWAGQTQALATPSPAAYRFYTRGRELMEERSPAAIRSAIGELEQAVHLDPDFALAWAALADATRGIIDDRQGLQEETLAKSLGFAQKAVQLNPQLPEAYTALAGVQQAQWDWTASERSYREAIRLDPKSPVAYRRYGGLILQFGDFDRAIEYTSQGLKLDPYDYPAHVGYALCLTMARRPQEAEDHLKWTLTQRDLFSAHANLSDLYTLRGRDAAGAEATRFFDLALAEAHAVHDLEVKGSPRPETSSTPVSDSLFAGIYARRGDRIASHRYLDRLLASPEIARKSPANLAEIYVALGETPAAIAYLQQAARIRDRGLLYLKVAPVWDPIRQTDGYKQVLLTMHL